MNQVIDARAQKCKWNIEVNAIQSSTTTLLTIDPR